MIDRACNQSNLAAACILMLAAILMFNRPSRGEEHDAPFVAGFDRFVRHGDIEPDVGGRLLLSELSCTVCHAIEDKGLQPKRGPNLDGVGDRMHADWLRAFLESPHSRKPGTTMPDVLVGFDEQEKSRAISALAAFLSTQHLPFPQLKAGGGNPLPHEFWKKGRVDEGQRLYHRIGCIACHEPDADYAGGAPKASVLDQLLEQLDPEEIEELGLTAAARPVRSVPYGDLAAKYTSKSLTFFLINPETNRPAGRMPNFDLEPVEAADIAAYLLREQRSVAGATAVGDPSLIAEGRRLFAKLRCSSCHSANGVNPARQATPLAELDADADKSCLGSEVQGLPHFQLDDAQAAAIRAAIKVTVSDASAKQDVEFQFLKLNCYACHERDKRGGVGRRRQRHFESVGHIDLGDEGRLPPPLSRVGAKLRTPWLEKVFGGEGDVRPHMIARMPRFAKASVAALPEMLVAADRTSNESQAEVFGEGASLVQAGRTLLDTGCVQCHPLRGESLPGVVGIDLAGTPGRIHPQWFREFLFNPGQLKPQTRMPTFFPNGKSASPAILNGDVDRQIAGMWAYLKAIDKQPLPDKIAAARSQSFELVPKDRPILMRTFMQNAGTHAVAVGFPQQVHFAFDAENVWPVEAWRGRFVDAYGTWFVRSAPPAVPLGVHRTTLPMGAPLALLKDDQEPWPTGSGEKPGVQFTGYRIGPRGVPAFLYRYGQFDVTDRIEPNDKKGLKRRLLIKKRREDEKDGRMLWFRCHVGEQLHRTKPNSYTDGVGLTVFLPENAARRGKLRKTGKQTEWIVPVEFGLEATIVVEYQW